MEESGIYPYEYCRMHSGQMERLNGLEKGHEISCQEKTTLIKSQTELRERIKGCEESGKSSHHRIDELSNSHNELYNKVDDLHKMTASFELMVRELQKQSEALEKLIIRMDNIEKAPGRLAISVWQAVGVSLVSVILGTVAGKGF